MVASDQTTLIIPNSQDFLKCGPGLNEGKLIVGMVGGTPAMFLKGFANYFEAGDPAHMAGPIELLTHIGVLSVLSPPWPPAARCRLRPRGRRALAMSRHFCSRARRKSEGTTACGRAASCNDRSDSLSQSYQNVSRETL
jgi:hypothetical protein